VVPVIETTKAQNYKIYVESLKDRTKLLNFFGYTGKELKQQINLGNLEQTEEECCSKAFLRGAFLVCGSITDPEKDYHIEFSVQRIALADGLMQIIDSLNMKCERLLRNSSCIVYSKDAAAYEDFVGHIGAARAYMEIIQIRATKDIKNQINRRANFEAANMARSIEAGLKQITLIESILKKISLSDMTDDLQQLCTLRMDNPDISLDELGSLMTPPLSRSAVGRRIKKLESISRELNSQ
jgi:DNA-binding protein WhiA